MKSAKLSPPDATRTGVCPAFKVGSPTSWMASASGPERLVIIKALMQGSLAGWIRCRVCFAANYAANYIDPSLIFCKKKPRLSKRYCQEWQRPSGCQPLGSDNEGLFARYLPSGIYSWRRFIEPLRPRLHGPGTGRTFIPLILARPAYGFAQSCLRRRGRAPLHCDGCFSDASGEGLSWI